MVGKFDLVEGVSSIFTLDTELKMFDGLMPLPDGTSYNSYIIRGSEKTAIIDTADARLVNQFLFDVSENKVEKLDYIISNHAEQDHSGCIPQLLDKFPEAVIVTNEKCKDLLISEFELPENKFKIIKDDEELSLGNKTLQFIFAPWVHWPETMFTFLKEDGILFSCDFFGAHIAHKETFVQTMDKVKKPAQRYYAEILMPYENFVKKHLERVDKLDVKMIAPSHGPVYQDPKIIIDLYKKWTSNKINPKIIVAYVSMHHNSEGMAISVCRKLGKLGIASSCYNLQSADIGSVVSEMMGTFGFIMCSPTYLGGLHPAAANMLYLLKGFRPNVLYHAFLGSFGWGGGADKEFEGMSANFRSKPIGSITTKGHPTRETGAKVDELLADIKSKYDTFLTENKDDVDEDRHLDDQQKNALLNAQQELLNKAIRNDPNAPDEIKFGDIKSTPSKNNEGEELGLDDETPDNLSETGQAEEETDPSTPNASMDSSESSEPKDETKTISLNQKADLTIKDDTKTSEEITSTDGEKLSEEEPEKVELKEEIQVEEEKLSEEEGEKTEVPKEDVTKEDILEATEATTESETTTENIKSEDVGPEQEVQPSMAEPSAPQSDNQLNLDEIKTAIGKKLEINDDVSLVICGEAGQGLQTIQQILTHLLINDGYNIFTTKEYMSRVRGGTNSVEIRISSENRKGFVNEIDILVPLDNKAIPHLKKRITDKTLIIGNEEIAGSGYEIINIPFVKLAQSIGNKVYANTITISFFFSLFNGDMNKIKSFIQDRFEKKGEKIVQDNFKAMEIGFELGKRVREETLTINMNKNERVSDNIYLCGTDAIGMGAIAGGCNFISNYPMSPSTGVLVFLAGQSNNFDIVVEQAEDEISAVNMGLGASFAGARSMVTTSGGGLALMSEGVSLCGIIETPIVLHIAQRPGPATGLPTRTGQEDLNLALHSGHGEFPRMIFAPGTLEDGFYMTMNAFNMAEKYQIPVFVLTDQYYVDTYYNTEPFKIDDLEVEKNVIKTEEGYLRYEYREDGVSPRGIPGHGDGLVAADSDEHDESGHITESTETRIRMNDKRLKKEETMMQDVIRPRQIGNDNYEIAVICWGSTYPTVKEAIDEIGDPRITLFHYTQVYPLHPDTEHIIKHAHKSIIIEMNATAQFAKLIRRETGIDITEKVLKYDGIMFSVEEIKTEILKRI